MIVFCAASCDGAIELFDKEECDYSVQLTYHYNQENKSSGNDFGRFIYNTDEYIFDDRGILCAIGTVTQDPCDGQWVSKYNLEPGRYSVIAVGNHTSMSRIHANNAVPEIGVTSRDDMMLTLSNRSSDGSDDGTNYMSIGRLYHGYRTFTVAQNGTSNIRVDMVHSHLDLRFTIKWKGDAAPTNTKDFYVILSHVPSEYALMPEYVYPSKGKCEIHNCDTHDEYNNTCLAVRHHIATVKKSENVVNHRRNVSMLGNTISSQTLSYRIRNQSSDCVESKISLWRTNATRSGIPEQLMKEISINDFLNRSGVNLDHSLKQQYYIIFEIDSDTGQVKAWFSSIADWENGGNIGW